MNKNTPFTHEQVKNLRQGFTPSGRFPNRKQRRSHLQKKNNNPNFGFHVHHYQWIDDKCIGHLSIHATKGNW